MPHPELDPELSRAEEGSPHVSRHGPEPLRNASAAGEALLAPPGIGEYSDATLAAPCAQIRRKRGRVQRGST